MGSQQKLNKVLFFVEIVSKARKVHQLHCAPALQNGNKMIGINLSIDY